MLSIELIREVISKTRDVDFNRTGYQSIGERSVTVSEIFNEGDVKYFTTKAAFGSKVLYEKDNVIRVMNGNRDHENILWSIELDRGNILEYIDFMCKKKKTLLEVI